MNVKKSIVSAMRFLYENGLMSARDGNISFKSKYGDSFLITAGSIDKRDITEKQIIRVDWKNSKTFLYDESGEYKPSREINMHSNLLSHPYYYDKDTFVVHAHPKWPISYMGLRSSNELGSIKKIFPELNVGVIGQNVPLIEAGSEKLAEVAFRNLLKNEIVGLERHGTLSIGTDLDRLIENIQTLDYYTEIAVNSKY